MSSSSLNCNRGAKSSSLLGFTAFNTWIFRFRVSKATLSDISLFQCKKVDEQNSFNYLNPLLLALDSQWWRTAISFDKAFAMNRFESNQLIAIADTYRKWIWQRFPYISISHKDWRQRYFGWTIERKWSSIVMNILLNFSTESMAALCISHNMQKWISNYSICTFFTIEI